MTWALPRAKRTPFFRSTICMRTPSWNRFHRDLILDSGQAGLEDRLEFDGQAVKLPVALPLREGERHRIAHRGGRDGWGRHGSGHGIESGNGRQAFGFEYIECIEIFGYARFLILVQGTQKPHEQEKGHQSGHEIRVRHFPTAAVGLAVPVFPLGLLDDYDGIVQRDLLIGKLPFFATS